MECEFNPRFYDVLAAQHRAVREEIEAAPAEELTFRHDAEVRGSCFGAYASNKITDDTMLRLAGIEKLPLDPCGEEEKGYGYCVGFVCVEDERRTVVLYDRWGVWRMSGDAATLAAFEKWASAKLE
jgi:hypothetical protein